MTPAEIKAIRERCGLSQREFGLALGFTEKNAKRTARGFEEGTHEVTGTARAAMRYLGAICTALDLDWNAAGTDGVLRSALPDFMRERADG